MNSEKNHTQIEMRLETEHLSIRPIKEEDAPTMRDLLENHGFVDLDSPSFTDFPSPGYLPEEEALSFIKEAIDDGSTLLALFQRDNEEKLLGFIEICPERLGRKSNKIHKIKHVVDDALRCSELLAEAYASITKVLFEKHDVGMLLFWACTDLPEEACEAEICGFVRDESLDYVATVEYMGKVLYEGYTMTSSPAVEI